MNFNLLEVIFIGIAVGAVSGAACFTVGLFVSKEQFEKFVNRMFGD